MGRWSREPRARKAFNRGWHGRTRMGMSKSHAACTAKTVAERPFYTERKEGRPEKVQDGLKDQRYFEPRLVLPSRPRTTIERRLLFGARQESA